MQIFLKRNTRFNTFAMGLPSKIITDICNELNINPNQFAKSIGLERAQIIYDLINGKTKSISNKLIRSITNTYPQFNDQWLLTGEGEMLKTPGKEGKGKETEEASNLTVGKVIPLYDAEAAAGNGYEMDMSPARPIEMIQIGGFLRESEAALRVYGSSMIPHYPPGCIVALKPWVERFIEPGAVYVVETTTNRYLKRLMYNADKTALRCLSDNTIRHEDGSAKGELCYPEFEIPVEDVRRLFRVVGVIKRNII